jgi:uncharacterized membrane protein YvlD (DUF360 family)
MPYLRSLLLNFLVVFFVDRIIPGIEVSFFENVPNIGADIVFSAVVGFLNSLIFPLLLLLELNPTTTKIGVISFVISYAAFISIAFFNWGIASTSILGIIVGGFLVWMMSFFTNYLELKHAHGTEKK